MCQFVTSVQLSRVLYCQIGCIVTSGMLIGHVLHHYVVTFDGAVLEYTVHSKFNATTFL